MLNFLSKNTKLTEGDKSLIQNYILAVIVFCIGIGIFSLFMSGVAAYRNSISETNYYNTSRIYGGSLEQSAPVVNEMSKDNYLYNQYQLTDAKLKTFQENTFLMATEGTVNIKADFVKKGLAYQPAFQTEFNTTYTLKNNLNEKSFVSFEFPFPFNSDTNEISEAKLLVNGQEIKDAKTKINYFYTKTNDSQNVDGLKWEGEIEPQAETKISISYKTVGLSYFNYEGLENPKGAQDFHFQAQITGTRLYDVISGLAVDRREFGADKVTLIWEKNSLYSQPTINIQVGEKLNPSIQVSHIYFTMAPIYLIFIASLLYLSFVFGRKMHIFDMFLVTVLFVIYFPLIHYLSSFTIDPTMEIFSRMNNGVYYSMPLYLAFGIAWVVISGLIYYLLGKISGFKFATKLGIPSLMLFLGFFPLVVTIPEYAMLMVIIGFIAFIMIVLQIRIKKMNA